MRILQVGATFVGAQQLIEESIHNFLLSIGHKSRILFAIGESDDPEIIRYESKSDQLMRRSFRKVVGPYDCFANKSTEHLIREIEEFHPDIIHIHTIHHGYINYAKMFEYIIRNSIPVVYTLHDMWPFTGGCYYYTAIGCNGYLSGCVNCPSLQVIDCKATRTSQNFKRKRDLYQRLKSIVFVAVSDWVHEEAMKSMIQGYPIYTVWNAISAPQINGIQRNLTGRFRIIGVAASWGERKGVYRFFELARMLGENCEIILVGSMSAELRSKAPSNVQSVGMISDKEKLFRLYASVNIHVSMSVEETFGITFVEAAIAGIRSIGFQSSAITDVIQKLNGYVVSSVKEVEKKIREIMMDRKLAFLGEAEIDNVKQQFSVNIMCNEYLGIYRSVLGRGKRTMK